jgi:hypothetical protein
MYNTPRLTQKGNEHDDEYVQNLFSLRGKSKHPDGVAKKTFYLNIGFALT